MDFYGVSNQISNSIQGNIATMVGLSGVASAALTANLQQPQQAYGNVRGTKFSQNRNKIISNQLSDATSGLYMRSSSNNAPAIPSRMGTTTINKILTQDDGIIPNNLDTPPTILNNSNNKNNNSNNNDINMENSKK